jgi:hypothetical protein
LKTFLAAHAEDFTTSLFRLYHLRFETMEHGGEYPDTMPQAIKIIEGRSCIYERADGPRRAQMLPCVLDAPLL